MAMSTTRQHIYKSRNQYICRPCLLHFPSWLDFPLVPRLYNHDTENVIAATFKQSSALQHLPDPAHLTGLNCLTWVAGLYRCKRLNSLFLPHFKKFKLIIAPGPFAQCAEAINRQWQPVMSSCWVLQYGTFVLFTLWGGKPRVPKNCL